ncbi:hypothetical protein MHUMG1_09877 [Metarhizium humberi]|uniref:Uncharacterized protein n=1 Tax=Metarhizium humberi TaxID=2596975 RepID=A0A9P8M1B4_9HYPO|nr:hypothetical protein MHUMG1_09877 [Metarhizium humberi]
MNWINDGRYSFGTETKLKLDSIVITHWDHDHYDGITVLLQSEVGKLNEGNPNPIPKISFLKWTGGVPDTILYCPRHKRIGQWGRKIKGISDVSEFYVAHDDAFQEDMVYIKPDANNTWTDYQFAKLRVTDESIWDVLAQDAGMQARPILCRRDEAEFGHTYGLKLHSSSAAISCVRRGVTLTNQSSIAAMVLWAGSKGANPRASNYLAGDMGQTYEKSIQQWLCDGGVKHIRSVKLSHHGSHFSTPLKMFEKFNPLNTFIPTPIHATHGHPSWPVIFLWNKQELPDEIDLVKEYGKTERLAYIANRFAAIWGQCGFPTTEYHPSSCGAFSAVNGQSAGEFLLFILIKSYDDDGDDGDLRYVNIGGGDLQKPTPKPITKAVDLTNLPQAKQNQVQKTNAKFEEKQEGRDADMDLLEHARVLEDAIYVSAPTNPNEMDNGMISDQEDSGEDGFALVRIPSSPRAGPKAKGTGWQAETVTAPDISWAIYTSDISEADIRAAGVIEFEFERLPSGPLNDFVSDLHHGVLCLEARPPIETTAVSETRLVLADEWRAWFSDTLNSKALSLISLPGRSIAGFSQLVSLAPLGTGPGLITPGWLKFSSATDVLQQTFGTTTYLTPEGLLDGHCCLVLCMEPSNDVQTVFPHDLVNFIGMGEFLKNPLIVLLGAVPVSVPSSAEELKEKRNAVWFIPSNDYRTVVRLEWSMHDESRNKLNEVLSPLRIKLLSPTSVIARRSSQWSTTSDKEKIYSKGSLVFRTGVELEHMVLQGTVEFGVLTTTLALTLNSTSSSVLQILLKWAAAVLGISADSFDFTRL